MAVYPTGLPTSADIPDAGADLSTNPHEDLHNDMRDEIVAICAELGVSPSGSFATVGARLNALPRGDVGRAVRTSGSAAITTSITDLPGLSVTFTGVAGRRYLAIAHAMLVKSTGAAGDTVNMYVSTGADVQLALSQIHARGVSDTHTHTALVTFTSTGATTIKLRANTSAGSMVLSASATNPATLVVVDIGPT